MESDDHRVLGQKLELFHLQPEGPGQVFWHPRGFAVYRAESNVFNLLVPRFGDLGTKKNRRRLLDYWLRSKLFHVSGLNAADIEHRIMTECKSGGDFLRITMEETARQQGVDRWADCTPDHLLNIPEIRDQLPGVQGCASSISMTGIPSRMG